MFTRCLFEDYLSVTIGQTTTTYDRTTAFAYDLMNQLGILSTSTPVADALTFNDLHSTMQWNNLIQLGLDFPARNFHVVSVLDAQPVPGRQSKIFAEPQIRIRCYRSFTGNDFTDPLGRNTDILGNAIFRDIKRKQKLFV
jgi:hypothetical protein